MPSFRRDNPKNEGAPTEFDPCSVEHIDMIVAPADDPDRLFAVVEFEGDPAALLVDTGSQLTFLSTPEGSPDGVEDAGIVTLGCRERSLIGRPFDLSEESTLAGLPVIGILGSDHFLERPTRVDFVEQHIRRAAPGDRRAGIELPFTDVNGYIFVDVELDGTPVFLGFDTGAGHTLWIAQDGEPGDKPVSSQDAYGNPLTFFLGEVDLGFAGLTHTVPVLRIQHFPSYEDSNHAQGIDTQGLFGLSAMDADALVVQSGASTILFEGMQ